MAPLWRNSDAKQLLIQMLVDGEIPPLMGPRVVYDMKSVLFKEFVYENFHNNLYNLRKKVKGDKDSAAFDSAALQNNKRRHPAAAITAHGHIH
jgi:hypothetical protein